MRYLGIKKIVVFILTMMIFGACSNAPSVVAEKTYKLPSEFKATLALEGNNEDIIFDANIIVTGESLAMLLKGDIDGIIITVEKGRARIKYDNLSIELVLPDSSPIMRLYYIFREFDTLEKLTTVDGNTSRVTVGYKNQNYDVIFEGVNLKTISTAQLKLTVV